MTRDQLFGQEVRVNDAEEKRLLAEKRRRPARQQRKSEENQQKQAEMRQALSLARQQRAEENRQRQAEKRQSLRLARQQRKSEENQQKQAERHQALSLARQQRAEENRQRQAEKRQSLRLARQQRKSEENQQKQAEMHQALSLARQQRAEENRQRQAEKRQSLRLARQQRKSEENQQKQAEMHQALSLARQQRAEENRQRQAEKRQSLRLARQQRKSEENQQKQAEMHQALSLARQQRAEENRQRQAESRPALHLARRQRRTEEKQRELEKERLDRRQQRQRDPVWRWSDGKLTFFNLNRSSRHVPAEVDIRLLEVEEIPSALVSRQREPALPPGTFSGAVYRKDGHIVPEFLEHDELTKHRVNKRVNVPVMERARIDEADRIYDTCIYLGRWSPNFGQFLLESLASAWYLTKADRSVPLVFHSSADRLNVPPFALAILKALNVQPSRIRVVARRDLRVSKLILPSSQFWPGIRASPGMCTAFDHVRERMLQSRPGKRRTPEKVYLSRRAFGAQRAAVQPAALIQNEEAAETFFRSLGYEILQPELLDFDEQVAIVANATHVAGPSGSALHLMLFNANPRARLIELRTKQAINQLLISAIRGYEAFHISCLAKGEPPGRTMLDMDVVERAVREIG